jgi:hypothetical protein
MALTNRQIAEAFSGHRFDHTVDQLAEDVRWDLVGQQPLTGKPAVVAACRQSAAELAGVSATFESFTVVDGDGCVVVDSVARYADGDGGESVVSSCDIYTFAGETLAAIKTYAVELAR